MQTVRLTAVKILLSGIPSKSCPCNTSVLKWLSAVGSAPLLRWLPTMKATKPLKYGLVSGGPYTFEEYGIHSIL